MKWIQLNLVVRDVGHCTFPDDVTMPADVEGATLQTSIRALKRMTQIPGENLHQESTK